MAHRIVSWSDNDIHISPVLSSAASMVSFDSTFSETYPSFSKKPPTISGFPSAGLGTKHTSLPSCSEGRMTARGGSATPDDSFIRHDAYFFEDGNVTFLVDGTLYCVHRFFFSRDSVYFSTRFAQLGIRDHEALLTIISIGDIERKDFEAILSILYPSNFEEHELTYEQWKSVLHLSTCWSFTSLRKLALRSIKPPTPHDQLILARTYSVGHWVLPSLTALCSRTLPLSLGEARKMSMEDVVLVATVREEIRGSALGVDATDIPRHVAEAEVEAQQAKLEDDTKGIADTVSKGKVKADAEAREKREANAKAKAEVDAKVAEEAKIKGADGPKAATAKAELEAKQNAEKQRLEIETRSEIEVTKAKAEEERKRAEAERDDSRSKQEEQIARQRAADKAARAAANASASSPTSSWFSRFTASRAASAVNASSPSTELGPLRGPRGPGAPVQHPSSTSSPPHESVSTQSATPTTAVPPLASVVTSSPSLAWQERKLITDKQDGNQATAAFPAEVSAYVPKSETAVATADNLVPSNTTDYVSGTYHIVGGTTASDAQADKHANYAPALPKAESTRVPETALAEVGVSSRHSNDLDPGPASALPLPPVTSCQPCLVPGGIPLQMPQPYRFLRRETSTPNVLDAKNAGESPEASPVAPQDCAKADGTAAEPTLQLSQHSEAGDWGSPITKGGEPNPEGPVKLTLRLDDIREVSTASAMATSGFGAPVNDASSSWLEEKDDSDVPSPKLTKAQMKRMRDRARKQARMGKKSSPGPPFWATSNNLSVSNSNIQEPKPITTALVNDLVGKGESECVDRCDNGERQGLCVGDCVEA